MHTGFRGDNNHAYRYSEYYVLRPRNKNNYIRPRYDDAVTYTDNSRPFAEARVAVGHARSTS
jgi:hypothetical protein